MVPVLDETKPSAGGIGIAKGKSQYAQALRSHLIGIYDAVFVLVPPQ